MPLYIYISHVTAIFDLEMLETCTKQVHFFFFFYAQKIGYLVESGKVKCTWCSISV